MAKINTGISVDQEIHQQAKEAGERHHWNFSDVVEIGLRLFLAQYGKTQLPGLLPAPDPSPELEQVPQ